MSGSMVLISALFAVALVLIVMIANLLTVLVLWGWIRKYIRRIESCGSVREY